MLVWLVGSVKTVFLEKTGIPAQNDAAQVKKNLKENQDSCEFGTLKTLRQELKGSKCYSWLQI